MATCTDWQFTVAYFAILREQRGCSQETLLTSVATAADLYGQLRQQHCFSLPSTAMRVAVNGELQPWDVPLQEGDCVIFIPPVAGG